MKKLFLVLLCLLCFAAISVSMVPIGRYSTQAQGTNEGGNKYVFADFTAHRASAAHELQSGGSISGVVNDDQGKPIAGAQVFAWEYQGQTEQLRPYQHRSPACSVSPVTEYSIRAQQDGRPVRDQSGSFSCLTRPAAPLRAGQDITSFALV